MKVMDKYKLIEDDYIKIGDTILYRIEALKDFGDVRKGDLGGYIQSYNNLSKVDNSWIYDNARVYGNAYVCNNAKVHDNAEVYGKACIYDYAKVYNDACVHDYAVVYDTAEVYGEAEIFNYACIFHNAHVYGNTEVYDKARIFDKAKVYGDARVFGYSYIGGNACIYDKVKVYGNADIVSDAEVRNLHDYIVFKNWWSSGRFFTWTRSNNMWKVGCFYGTGKELIKKAYEDSEISGREYERVVNYVESILKEK